MDGLGSASDFSTMVARPLNQSLMGLGAPGWIVDLLFALFGVIATLISVTVLVMLALWAERRFLARLQDRLGPNRVGRFGLLQSPADVLKLLSKELIRPARADRFLHFLAPVVGVGAMVMSWAIVPWGPGLQVADINVGVVYLLAFGGLPVMAIVMAGWGSNNKYALFGGMRAVVQYLSYEVPGGVVLIIPVLLAGTMSLQGVVAAQSGPFWNWFVFKPVAYAFGVVPVPLLVIGFPSFALYLATGLAECNRTPFDHVEADSELAGGYFTEYSGMQWALFMLTEYGSASVLCLLAATLFLGGYHTGLGASVDAIFWPVLPALLLTKGALLFLVLVWIRGTLPRFRYDQLMQFAWKRLLPLGLALVGGTALLLPVTHSAAP
jgi:NADH-quinone oxidoreductase subunit H